ncbi:hypothetical protein D3C78_1561830 [compost metagenome]
MMATADVDVVCTKKGKFITSCMIASLDMNEGWIIFHYVFKIDCQNKEVNGEKVRSRRIMCFLWLKFHFRLLSYRDIV